MRLLATADIHIGVTRFTKPGRPHSRLEDIGDLLDLFVRSADAARVDLAIVAGDLFDSRSPSPRHIATAARFLHRLTDVCPVVLDPGNHDGPSVVGDPLSHTLRWLWELEMPRLWVPLLPDVQRFDGAVVAAMPYPHKRSFDLLMPDADPVERHAALSKAADAAVDLLFLQAGEVAKPGDALIFTGHLSAVGATVGSERTMRLEDDVSVGTHALDAFDAVILGHIHKHQSVGRKGWYAGSPHYIDFGEAGDQKGFLLVEANPGKMPTAEVIGSGARPMLVLHGSGQAPVPPGPLDDGPIVRLTVAYPDRETARRDREAALAAWYEAGASFVDWDVRVPERKASERALAAGTSAIDGLTAYLTGRGLDPADHLAVARDIMGS
jgi:DNA repair protein SbcD/Mre11